MYVPLPLTPRPRDMLSTSGHWKRLGESDGDDGTSQGEVGHVAGVRLPLLLPPPHSNAFPSLTDHYSMFRYRFCSQKNLFDRLFACFIFELPINVERPSC
jgi:hypothetical protein